MKPLGFYKSILFFAIPSGIAWFGIYFVMQKLHQAGVNDFANFFISFVIPLSLMLIASLVAYRADGYRFNWKTFAERFRLKRMTKTDWLCVLILISVQVGLQLSLQFTAKWLVKIPFFSPPGFLVPVVDPNVDPLSFTSTFLGISLKGQWWVAVVYFIILLFNIFGEEFWWRGYILPRQELAFGKWTWVIHGLMWTLFHSFWKWNLLILLPSCLFFSYILYKRKNTWIGIICHMLFNSIPLILIILGIIG